MKSAADPPAPPPTGTVSAWAVYAWPAVLWQAPCEQECRFRHLGTQVTQRAGRDAPCSGQTVWGDAQGAGGPLAGLAWDWVELGRGVVAMADPMAVITNLRLVGPRGTVLTPLQAAPHLNGLVHALPWQDEVRRELERGGH